MLTKSKKDSSNTRLVGQGTKPGEQIIQGLVNLVFPQCSVTSQCPFLPSPEGFKRDKLFSCGHTTFESSPWCLGCDRLLPPLIAPSCLRMGCWWSLETMGRGKKGLKRRLSDFTLRKQPEQIQDEQGKGHVLGCREERAIWGNTKKIISFLSHISLG